MARTDTEVYRRFRGSLRPRPLRFLPITAAGLRVATKKKLPLVLLYAPPAIATTIFSFVVYAKFAFEAELSTRDVSLDARIAAAVAGQFIEVRDQIAKFYVVMQVFGLLVATWFGAGLIAEDRRLGAHLLYFSRPLTRLDYYAGKFLIAAALGSLAVFAPGAVIYAIAVFSSPEWSFLKAEGGMILKIALFASMWTVVVVSIVLAISALVQRRTYALAGVFGFFLLSQALAQILFELLGRRAFQPIGTLNNLLRINDWLFEVRSPAFTYPVGWAFGALAAVTAIAWTVAALRLKRLEVVA